MKASSLPTLFQIRFLLIIQFVPKANDLVIYDFFGRIQSSAHHSSLIKHYLWDYCFLVWDNSGILEND